MGIKILRLLKVSSNVFDTKKKPFTHEFQTWRNQKSVIAVFLNNKSFFFSKLRNEWFSIFEKFHQCNEKKLLGYSMENEKFDDPWVNLDWRFNRWWKLTPLNFLHNFWWPFGTMCSNFLQTFHGIIKASQCPALCLGAFPSSKRKEKKETIVRRINLID